MHRGLLLVAVLFTVGLPLLVATVRSTRHHPDGHGPSPLEIASSDGKDAATKSQ